MIGLYAPKMMHQRCTSFNCPLEQEKKRTSGNYLSRTVNIAQTALQHASQARGAASGRYVYAFIHRKWAVCSGKGERAPHLYDPLSNIGPLSSLSMRRSDTQEYELLGLGCARALVRART